MRCEDDDIFDEDLPVEPLEASCLENSFRCMLVIRFPGFAVIL